MIPELVALAEARPALLKRGTARAVFDGLAVAPLVDAIGARLEALVGSDPELIALRGAALLQIVAARPDAARAVADRLLALHPALGDKGQPREARALARKAIAARDA